MTNEEIDRYFERKLEERNVVTVTQNPDDPNVNDIRIDVKSEFEAVCDFCGQGACPLNTHPADSIEIFEDQWSEGDWAACDPCTVLIFKMDKDGLRDRALAKYKSLLGDRPSIGYMVTMSHDAFWKARKEPSSAP